MFNAFAFEYLNKVNINYSLQEFITEFSITDQLLEQFTTFANNEFKVRMQRNEFLHSKENMKQLLKAEIARHLFLENGYYQVMNNYDPEVQRALKCF